MWHGQWKKKNGLDLNREDTQMARKLASETFFFFCHATWHAGSQFSAAVVQWPSCVWLFVTLWTAANQASQLFTSSRSDAIQPPHPLSSPSPPSLNLFPASGSSSMSWLFASGGQSTGASASASVLPMNIQGWFHLGLTGWISLGQLLSVIPWLGIKSEPPSVKMWSLNHWTAREVSPENFLLTMRPWKWKLSVLVMSDSLWPHGLEPTRLLRPWNFAGKSTGVGCHLLLQRFFPTQGLNPFPFSLLRWQEHSLPLAPIITTTTIIIITNLVITGISSWPTFYYSFATPYIVYKSALFMYAFIWFLVEGA